MKTGNDLPALDSISWYDLYIIEDTLDLNAPEIHQLFPREEIFVEKDAVRLSVIWTFSGLGRMNLP